MKITLTGSLGHISRPLAEQLLKQGHEITVISSNADKQKEIETLGAKAAIGSVLDAEFLQATFTGADAVYCMIPPNFTAPDSRAYYQAVGRSYADAIQAADVKRVVHLSSWGAHLPEGTGFITGSHDVEQILNELQGINVTHLRPGSFYYNLYHFINMIKNTGFIVSNYGGEDKVVMAAPADIADAAAEELTTTGSGKVRYIASEDITATATAAILGEAIGKPDLRWVTFTDQQALDSRLQAGIPSRTAEKMVELNAAIHSGAMREDYDKHPPVKFGKVKLAEFAKEFAAVYFKK
jgi:uncharacterized protein YbjT (DUF2867 family)